MEIKEIKCPVCGKVMHEHMGQGDINFFPTHLVSSNNFFPESINCVIIAKYSCFCGTEVFISESRIYKGTEEVVKKEVKKDDFPCDSCMHEVFCKEGHECDTLKEFKKKNPLSLRGRPMTVRLGVPEGKEEEYSPKKN